MKLVADMHCHTVASTHAYSTVQEMVQAAKKKEIEIIAITDHGIKMPDAPHPWYFQNIEIMPEEIDGVRVLKGVEANIIDLDGNLDMPCELLDRLELVIASFHNPCLEPGSISENTEAVISAIKNPYVNIIGHPDNPIFPVSIDEVVAAAKEYGKLIELNNKSHLVRKGSEINALKFAQKAKEYNAQVVFGSDAHISFEVGDFAVIMNIIKEVGLPEELIINTSKEKVLSFVNGRKNKAR